MEQVKKNLLIKLNSIINMELDKDVEAIDDILVREAVDGILRTKKESEYQIPLENRQNSIRNILNYADANKIHLSKAAKIILAAAIIISLLLMSVLAYSYIEYKINHYESFSIILFDHFGNKLDHPIEASYIPDGYYLIDSEDHKHLSVKEYINDLNQTVSIAKDADPDHYSINTEYSDSYSRTINEIEYIFFGEYEHGKGLIFVKGKYVFTVVGALPEDELLKIAQGLD